MLSIELLEGKNVKTCLSSLQANEFFYVPTTARSTPQGSINFSHPPEADVKDGCPFLASSFGQAKEGEKKNPFLI